MSRACRLHAIAVLTWLCCGAANAAPPVPAPDLPPEAVAAGLVNVAQAVPDALLDIRYAGTRNFVGSRIDGYDAPRCWLHRPAAAALARVAADLRAEGLRLKLFDCYRPARAVAHFMRWAADLADQRTKAAYYPHLDKSTLVPGYIAERSGHSRGATVDLGLARCDASGICTELDMGTTFDFFDTLAHTDDPRVTPAQRAHRERLRTAMQRHGFANYDQEWWHYTFKPEPTPATYFDIPLRASAAAGHGKLSAPLVPPRAAMSSISPAPVPETVEHETAPNPRWAVIWLHGLGADGHDFLPIVPELLRPGWPALRFVFPHAPVRAVTINNGVRMRAWYDIREMNLANRADIDGVRESMAAVAALIARENARGIGNDRILLAGFSQGGAVTLAAAANGLQVAGFIALSTYLPMAADTPPAVGAAKAPLFMAHGRFDPVVPFAAGQLGAQQMQALGFQVEWRAYPMQHQVSAEEIADLSAWMGARFR